MEETTMANSELFLDAAYAIALSVSNDQHHERAMALRAELKLVPKRLVTTRAVLVEIGNALAKSRYRVAAIRLLESLEGDPSVEIIQMSEDLYDRALQLYRDRLDKEWGITDCVSFVVMRDRGLTSALTTDEHFQQAGFRAMLRDG
jgi:predicted nucleic acid-binding protein